MRCVCERDKKERKKERSIPGSVSCLLKFCSVDVQCRIPVSQITTREQKAKPALEGVVDKVQRVLERVCKEVNRQAKLYQVCVRFK